MAQWRKKVEPRLPVVTGQSEWRRWSALTTDSRAEPSRPVTASVSPASFPHSAPLTAYFRLSQVLQMHPQPHLSTCSSSRNLRCLQESSRELLITRMLGLSPKHPVWFQWAAVAISPPYLGACTALAQLSECPHPCFCTQTTHFHYLHHTSRQKENIQFFPH